MNTLYSRTRMLIGEKNLDKLKLSKVLVFGVGGVGGYVIESLVRAGLGHITIVDFDTISESNLNRQIIALNSTLGKLKVDVMKERCLDINSALSINIIAGKVTVDNIDSFGIENYDYVVDAIDDVSAKVAIIKSCHDIKIPIISSMGTGNKLNPMSFKIKDIKHTHTCPLAKAVRKQLYDIGIRSGVKTIFSEESPQKAEDLPKGEKAIPASISFLPSTAGLLIGSEVVKDIINKQ